MPKPIHKISTLIIAILLLTTSCEYENDDKNYHQLTPPVEDTISLKFALAEHKLKDTITITQKTNLPYTITLSSGKIKNIIFTLGTDTLKQSVADTIKVDTILSLNKIYQLKLELQTTTNTSSLEDIYEREGINIKDSTVLYIKYITPSEKEKK